MRVLVLMRGLPASGKSSWIAKWNLTPYALSPDTLRLMTSAPILLPQDHQQYHHTHQQEFCQEYHTPTTTPESKIQESILHNTRCNADYVDSRLYAINQKYDKHIWKMLFELLELRLERGDFTIIDATHTSNQALRAYENLASTYRYRLVVMDCSDVPLDEIYARNSKRGYKAVPQEILRSMSERLQEAIATPLSSRYLVLKPSDISEHSQHPLQFSPMDLNGYEKIHHIGDIHGCFEALIGYLLRVRNCVRETGDDDKQNSAHTSTDDTYTTHIINHTATSDVCRVIRALEENAFSQELCVSLLDSSAYYIFLGDYIDRGVGNASVVRFLLAIMNEKNVCLLEGNHERWLNFWGNKELGNNEFSAFTMRDFMRDSLTPKDAHRLYSKLRQCAFYTFDSKLVLCTHGGLSTLPSNLLLIATRLLIYGSGDYEDLRAVAKSFADTTASNVYQVFGHRNREKCAMRLYGRNFALEGGVEFGGALRALILVKSSHKTTQAKDINAPTNAPKPLIPNRILGDGIVGDSVYPNAIYTYPTHTNSINIAHQTTSHLRHSLRGELLACVYRGDGFCELSLQNNKTPHIAEKLHARNTARKIFALLEKLRTSHFIKERVFGDISSFNFTKDAFFNKKWNALTCKARGLFIDTKSYAICARSYDKFFNIDEVEQTREESLKQHLCYPISVYVKENGFLGIMSANPLVEKSVKQQLETESSTHATHIKKDKRDSGADTMEACELLADSTSSQERLQQLHTHKLFITSKSDALSEYATYARACIESALHAHAKATHTSFEALESKLYERLKTQNLSLVFEIIDSINDPHIIAYTASQAIMLDAIYNEPNFRKISYSELIELGSEFGFSVKHKIATLHSFSDYTTFITRHSTITHAQSVESALDSSAAKSSPLESTISGAESMLDSSAELDSTQSYLAHSGARSDEYIEGFVFEDASGFMFKFKTPYYRFWKAMRANTEHYAKHKKLPTYKHKHPLESAFNAWLQTLESISNPQDIIALREQFLRDRAEMTQNYKTKA